MLSWLTGKVAGWACGVLLLALLAATGVAKYQAREAADAREAARVARTELQQARDAARGSNEAVTACTAAIAEWKALVTPAATVKASADRATAAADRIAARSAALTENEESDRANPDCAALLAVDLARACPAHARSVRERARGDLQGPDRPSARAGRGAAAGAPDG